MTLEESSVIVANLIRDLPHRKASRSATATATAAAAGGHSSSAVASGAVGSVLRSKKRDLSATSEGFLDHDSSLSFQFNLDNSSSSISPYATSAFPSSLTPGLLTDSMAMEPNQSLFSSRALSPIILDDIDSTHLFNTNDAVDVPFNYEVSDQTVPAIEEHEVERVTTAVVAEPVIPPKRSHRKKEGNRSRDRKRSRTKTTPKKAATVGGKDSMQVSKNSSSSSSSSSSSVALNAIARIKGSEASRASAKTNIAKSSSSATVKSTTIAKVAEDEDDDSAPQMFLPALSPLEFFPLGQFPGSTSPMLVTSREGATPRGSSAAFVLLTTKCSVMTSLASPKFVQTASTSAVITTTTSTTDGKLHSPPRPLHSPRSSPLGGSPIKVQSSSSSLQVVIDQTSYASSSSSSSSSFSSSSSSSSSSVVPPPRSTRRMRAQVQYVQRGDEPDEEILLLFGTTTCDPLSSTLS
jgi:hypothetical protein